MARGQPKTELDMVAVVRDPVEARRRFASREAWHAGVAVVTKAGVADCGSSEASVSGVLHVRLPGMSAH